MSTVLDIRDLTRVHGQGESKVNALRGVSLQVAAGELVAVMGPSGSGKSTLLTIAGGHDSPTGGTVTIEGTEIGRQSGASESTTSTGAVLAQASISRIGRMPTDS
jgi:putative ABC transport system ATP-binding protein